MKEDLVKDRGSFEPEALRLIASLLLCLKTTSESQVFCGVVQNARRLRLRFCNREQQQS